jgi:GrpB-like predicted nucleotidyltransferase (UPF0157 family)
MAKVVVSSYCSAWPEISEAVRRELLGVFAPLEVGIEHIGSTAVPGLAAKPVIDVLVGAASLADIEARIGGLEAVGYSYVSKYEAALPLRRYFVKAPAEGLRIHVHGVERGARLWREHLAFRDALRADEELRARYQELKLRLAREFADDKTAYTEAKGPFIEAAVRRAVSSGGDAGEA